MSEHLPGAACADLHPIAIDHYLTEPADAFARKTGKAICGRCVVMMPCRLNALDMPSLPSGGVLGGVTVYELQVARAWRHFETGLRDTAPQVSRPEWLPRSEAAEIVEQMRVELDADEGGDDE